jgi:hypothetical protein
MRPANLIALSLPPSGACYRLARLSFEIKIVEWILHAPQEKAIYIPGQSGCHGTFRSEEGCQGKRLSRRRPGLVAPNTDAIDSVVV